MKRKEQRASHLEAPQNLLYSIYAENARCIYKKKNMTEIVPKCAQN